MNVRETVVGIIGEFMLFLTLAFLVAAVAATLLALDGDAKEYVDIGTPFVVAAGAMYTARGYFEKWQWKKLLITMSIVAIALTMSGVGITDVTGATLWETVKGFLCVLATAIGVTLIVYVPRIAWLGMMYCQKRKIVKSVRSGDYSEAVKVAEGGSVAGTDYVKNPDKLSESGARALSCALERVGRDKDAERVRLVSESRNPLRS